MDIILCLLFASAMPQVQLNVTQHAPHELHSLQHQACIAAQPCQHPPVFCVLPEPKAALTFSDVGAVRSIEGTGAREKNDSWSIFFMVLFLQVTMFPGVPLELFKMEMDQLTHIKL